MKFKNILIILGSKANKQDIRSGVIVSICKAFGEKCKQNGIEVDFLDLPKERLDKLTEAKKKALQTRTENAEVIIFFFNTEFQSTPAMVQNFLEEVFEDGFAYKTHKKIIRPLLKKQAMVVCTTPFLGVDIFATGNILVNFWKKVIFRFCGFKGEVIVLDDLRGRSDKEMVSWKNKMEKIADNLSKK